MASIRCPSPRGKEARQRVAGAAAAHHGCLADPADAALVLSKLFANAGQHGPTGGPVLVSYCRCGDGLRVVVCDPGGITIPTLRAPHDLQEGGRGLHVADMISAAWGQFRVKHARFVYLRQRTFHRGAA